MHLLATEISIFARGDLQLHADANSWQCRPGRYDALNTFFAPGPLEPVEVEPPIAVIPFNSRLQGIRHFFIDDYRFERVWARPEYYVQKLQSNLAILQPDFSLYSDWPDQVNRWNAYRKWWLASFWSLHNVQVVPVPGWVDESSFKWCFDNYAKGGVVATCTMGCQSSAKEFNLGFYAMIDHLEPDQVWCFGKNMVNYKSIEYKYNFKYHTYTRI